jgi:hypothetical protein
MRLHENFPQPQGRGYPTTDRNTDTPNVDRSAAETRLAATPRCAPIPVHQRSILDGMRSWCGFDSTSSTCVSWTMPCFRSYEHAGVTFHELY